MTALKVIYESCTACTHTRQVHVGPDGHCVGYQCPCHGFDTEKTNARHSMVPVREKPRDEFADQLDQIEAEALLEAV